MTQPEFMFGIVALEYGFLVFGLLLAVLLLGSPRDVRRLQRVLPGLMAAVGTAIKLIMQFLHRK